MSHTDVWTTGRLLTWTTDYLKENGADSPRLDAEILLAYARHCQRIDLYTAFDQDPGEQVRHSFRALVKQRATGTPVAYLVGQREFFSLAFQVSPAVLIPRPETEFVVTAALDIIREHYADQAIVKLVDVGTGSGAIAIAIAKQLPQCHLQAIDSSPEALQVAQQNIAQHQVHSRVTLQQSDLFEQMPSDEQVHIVVSNPPYVSQSEYEQLDTSVRDHEPQAALLAGPSGLEVYERLLPQAAAHLFPHGWLILETSPQLHQALLNQLNENAFYEAVSTINDLAGLPRVLIAQRKASN